MCQKWFQLFEIFLTKESLAERLNRVKSQIAYWKQADVAVWKASYTRASIHALDIARIHCEIVSLSA